MKQSSPFYTVFLFEKIENKMNQMEKERLLYYRCIKIRERNHGMDEKNRTDVEKMIQGDESAFDELYRSFSGKLYRMADVYKRQA